MPIEIAALASTVVAKFLLPYVAKGAGAFADAISDSFSDTAADHATGIAQRLWNRVRDAFGARGDEQAVADFEQHPDAARPLLEVKLADLLRDDPALAQELEGLVSQQDPATNQSALEIVNSSYVNLVNAPGATITGGTVAGSISYGAPPPTTTGPVRQTPPTED
jgi:hypothetical protein